MCKGPEVGTLKKAVRLEGGRKKEWLHLGFGPGPSDSQIFHLQNGAVKFVLQR